VDVEVYVSGATRADAGFGASLLYRRNAQGGTLPEDWGVVAGYRAAFGR
jgi:hypothetical protein